MKIIPITKGRVIRSSSSQGQFIAPTSFVEQLLTNDRKERVAFAAIREKESIQKLSINKISKDQDSPKSKSPPKFELHSQAATHRPNQLSAFSYSKTNLNVNPAHYRHLSLNERADPLTQKSTGMLTPQKFVKNENFNAPTTTDVTTGGYSIEVYQNHFNTQSENKQVLYTVIDGHKFCKFMLTLDST